MKRTSDSRIIESDNPCRTLKGIVADTPHSGLFILTDTNVGRDVFPMIQAFIDEFAPQIFTMEAGEENKNIETLQSVWSFLSKHGANRNSLLINIGGGVVTDLGGFAAATFKRGIRFINLPTSLLAAADAASGGKTGIDFNGLKNEIGAFAMPLATIISSAPFDTLPPGEMISGFGEIVKMAMISDAETYRKLCANDFFSDSGLLQESL